MKSCVLLLLLLAPFASADDTGGYQNPDTGNGLYATCTAPESQNAVYLQQNAVCLSYIQGAVSTLNFFNHIDIEDGMTNEQFKDIVLKYLKENPEQRHYASPFSIFLAMVKDFPHKEKAKQ
jgi:hypothetical protein